jgi:NitT/TauT family transport system substrate-binding protein
LHCAAPPTGYAVLPAWRWWQADGVLEEACRRDSARRLRRRSPEAAIASIKKRDGTIDEAIEAERLKLVNKVSILTPFVLENGFGTIDKARMEQAIEQVAKALEMPRKPKVDEVFTDRFLPPREQRLVN